MPTDPSPFLRGLLPSVSGADGSRLPQPQILKLPADTVRAARVPAGVHLAFRGSAAALDLELSVGPPSTVPAPTLAEGFAVGVEGAGVTMVPVPLPASVQGSEPVQGSDSGRRAVSGLVASSTVRIPLPERDPSRTVRVYLPERCELGVTGVSSVGGHLLEAPRGPRWVVYGDSITQGWSVTRPGRAWPSLVADRLGLEAVNLGFAGAARGEVLAADVIAGSGAAAVAVAWGTNAWSSLPTDAGQAAETMRLFLTTVRQGLPTVPVVVVSPIVRPDAESVPNRFGTTHAALRQALEESVLLFRDKFGDEQLTLVPGLDLVPAEQLVDGIHPGDQGQASLAAGVAPQVASGLSIPLVNDRRTA